ncbi:MAG: stage II sporulation protein R [Ruminococcus sp.]|nr:stage II sporulation protein R [Ruminococcus sp.]
MAMLIGFTGAVCCATLSQTANSLQQLESSVLRLHILANSDSIDDQALKLKVRDGVLAYTSGLLDGTEMDLGDVECMVSAHLTDLEEAAQDIVEACGYDYPVTVELTEMAFEDRTYEDLVMPAGTYDTLRIAIGSAQGQNWWCVMYPALCLPSAAYVTVDDETESTVFSKEERDMLEHHEKYVIRLKCVEWLESIFS